MKTLLFTAALMSLLSTSAIAAESNMTLCTQLAEAWKAAYDNKDAGQVAALYDPANGLYSNSFWTATGHAALEQGFKNDLSLGATFNAITCNAAQRDGRLLVANGTYVGSVNGPDGRKMPMAGHWVATAEDKGGGKYLMMTHNANLQLPLPK